MSRTEELEQIAQESYLYLYPLVLMDVTRRVATNIPAGVKTGLGPANSFSHMRAFPPGDFKEVVRPNFDTLYSSAWLDLTEGPQVVSLTEPVDRYFMLPMIDMWTDVFAVVGSRTTGGGVADYAVTPPGWSGTLPDDMKQIAAPTPHIWIVGRTQTNGPADYGTVRAIQDSLRITALAGWPTSVEHGPADDPSVDLKTAPVDQVNAMSGADFFTYASTLMMIHPAHATDQPVLARMSRLGFMPGKEVFSPAAADEDVRQAIDQAAKSGIAKMDAFAPMAAPMVNGWSVRRSGIGVYGTDYLFRATVSKIGLGANLAEDAVYPVLYRDESGETPTGERQYVLHFDPGELPPADAFWSVTMYDQNGFTVPNELERYAIGDRDALRYGEDGSLDLFLGHTAPDSEWISNWLPAPMGPLGITLRVYSPRPEMLDGSWNPPPLRQVG